MSTTTLRRASEKRVQFISDLLDRKNLFASVAFFEKVNAMDSGELKMYVDHLKERAAEVSMQRASEMIETLKALPDNPAAAERGTGADPAQTEVPAGHYAVTGDDGTTDFYRVDKPEKGKWKGYTFVKLQLSDDYQNMPRATAAGILKKIEAAGPREAAIRYGHELGACAICNRTLTNPDSISAGIGPVCADKVGW